MKNGFNYLELKFKTSPLKVLGLLMICLLLSTVVLFTVISRGSESFHITTSCSNGTIDDSVTVPPGLDYIINFEPISNEYYLSAVQLDGEMYDASLLPTTVSINGDVETVDITTGDVAFNNIGSNHFVNVYYRSTSGFQLDDIVVNDVDLEKVTVNNTTDATQYAKSLKSGQTFTILGLSKGTGFKVTEEGNKNYTPSYEFIQNRDNMNVGEMSGDRGADLSTEDEVLSANTAVRYTNEKGEPQGGRIYVTKELTGSQVDEEQINTPVTFNYYFSGLDSTEDYVLYTTDRDGIKSSIPLVVSADGVLQGTFAIYPGTEAYFAGLPSGCQYEISEVSNKPVDATEYNISYNVTSGEDLVNVVNKSGTEVSAGRYSLSTTTDGVMESITNVNKPIAYTFTNSSYTDRNLKFTKIVRRDGVVLSGSDDEFNFNFEFGKLNNYSAPASFDDGYIYYTINGEYDGTNYRIPIDSFGDATGTITVHANDVIEFNDVPDDITVSFYEEPAEYKSSVVITDAVSGDVLNEETGQFGEGVAFSLDNLQSDIDAIIYNDNSTTSSLSLTKLFEGPLVKDTDSSEFTLTFKNLTPETTYAGIYTKKSGEEVPITLTADADGNAAYSGSLFNNEIIKFNELPKSAYYNITESANAYEPGFNVNEGRTHIVTVEAQGKVGEPLSTGDESLEVSRGYTWINTSPVPSPDKTVSDEDNVTENGVGEEIDVQNNMVPNRDASWMYRITHEIGSVDINNLEGTFEFYDTLSEFIRTDIDNVGRSVDEEGDPIADSETPIRIYWHKSNGTTVGGNIVRFSEDYVYNDEYYHYGVVDGNNVLFVLDDLVENNTESISVYMIDRTLLSTGGTFEIEIDSHIDSEVLDADIVQGGYITDDGLYFIFENDATTVIGDNTYSTPKVKTKVPKEVGLSVEKRVDSSYGEVDDDFGFTARFEGLNPDKTYSYYVVNPTKVMSSVNEGMIQWTAVDSMGNPVEDIKISLYRLGSEVSLRNVRTDETGHATMRFPEEGDYRVEATVDDSYKPSSEINIYRDGDDLTIAENVTLMIFGNETVTEFASDEDGNAEIRFSLKDGQQIMFKGLDNGVQYQVEEDPSNYVASFRYLQCDEDVPVKQRANEAINKSLSTEMDTLSVSAEPKLLFINTPKTTRVQFAKNDENSEPLSGAGLLLAEGEWHPDRRYMDYWSDCLASNNLMHTWTSDGTVVSYELPWGHTYTYGEYAVPDNYAEAEEVVFRITDTGIVQKKVSGSWHTINDDVVTFTLVDEGRIKVFVKKVSYAAGEMVPGATLGVYTEGGDLVETFVTERKPTDMILRPGDYVLKEITPPSGGWLIAEDVPFKVRADGRVEGTSENPIIMNQVAGTTVTEVEEQSFTAQFSKVAVGTTSPELSGAVLSITEKGETEPLESWTSTSTPYSTNNLKVGHSYIFSESEAPQGYQRAADIEFRINEARVIEIKQPNGSWVAKEENDVVIRMEDAPNPKSITVSKTDITGSNELAGAELKIVEGTSSTGTIAKDYATGDDLVWVSTLNQHTVTLSYGKTYTLVETTAPTGYEVAESITFRITDDGTLEVYEDDSWVAKGNSTVQMKDDYDNYPVYISKKIFGTENNLSNAVLRVMKGSTEVDRWTTGASDHELQLPMGSYVLEEVTPPTGYLRANPIAFTINADGTITSTVVGAVDDNVVTMYDEEKENSIQIEKFVVDADERVPGATLELKRGSTVIDTWTTGTTSKSFDLVQGDYTLTEIDVPNGYLQADPVTFNVDGDGNVTITSTDGEAVYDDINEVWSIIMRDAPASHPVYISKKIFGTETSLAGASLEIRDLSNVVVKDAVSGDDLVWNSTTDNKLVNLGVGTYTLVETNAPAGYLIASPITFTVGADGSVTSSYVGAVNGNIVTMYDTSKVGGVSLVAHKTLTGGAVSNGQFTFQLKEGNTLLEEKTNDGNGNVTFSTINYTANDIGQKTYTIVEISGSDPRIHYDVSVKTVTVDISDGTDSLNVTTVPSNAPHAEIVNSYNTTEVDISKTEITGSSNLEGAELKLHEISPDTSLVEEWTSSSTEDHRVTLDYGKTYTLTEVTAPQGYDVAEVITFRITDTGKVEIKQEDNSWVEQNSNRVVMKDAYKNYPVYISKKIFGTSTNLAGATLKVYNESNEEVASIVSTTSDVKVDLPFGEYTIRETDVPTGYMQAGDIRFRVNKDGSVALVSGADGNVAKSGENWVVTVWDRTLHSIVISKNVTGDYGNLDKAFVFSVEFTGLIPGEQYNVGGAVTKTFVASNTGDGDVSFSLKDDEQVSITGLPDNCTWKVTEDESDHIASYNITLTGTQSLLSPTGINNAHGTALSTAVETFGSNSGDITVAFTNNREAKNTTGVSGTNNVVYILLGASAMLVIALMSLLIVLRRRRKPIM